MRYFKINKVKLGFFRGRLIYSAVIRKNLKNLNLPRGSASLLPAILIFILYIRYFKINKIKQGFARGGPIYSAVI